VAPDDAHLGWVVASEGRGRGLSRCEYYGPWLAVGAPDAPAEEFADFARPGMGHDAIHEEFLSSCLSGPSITVPEPATVRRLARPFGDGDSTSRPWTPRSGRRRLRRPLAVPERM